MEKINNENPLNFRELAEEFLNHYDAKKNSLYMYKASLKNFFIFLADNNIIEPTKEDYINYKTTLREQGIQPATISFRMTVCRIFFQWLEENKIYNDITKRIKLEHVDKFYKKDSLTENQVKSLLRIIDRSDVVGKRDYAMILLMTICGLRTIELVRAKLGDIRNIGNQSVLFIQGKGKLDKNEFVKLPNEVEEALRDYIKGANIIDDNEFIFKNFYHKKLNKSISTTGIRNIVNDKFKKIGIKSNRITTHSLRHTAATLNLLAGGTLQETQQLLRHKDINKTLIYCHNLSRLNNQSEQRISNMIFNATK